MGRFDGLIEAARLGGRVYNLTTDRDLQIVRGGTLYTLGPGMASPNEFDTDGFRCLEEPIAGWEAWIKVRTIFVAGVFRERGKLTYLSSSAMFATEKVGNDEFGSYARMSSGGRVGTPVGNVQLAIEGFRAMNRPTIPASPASGWSLGW